MLTLDLRTIIVLATIMGALMSILLYCAYLSFPKIIGGFKAWVIGTLCMTASGILLLNTGAILPNWLGIPLGDFLYIGAIQTWREGCLQLFDPNRQHRWLLPQILLAVLMIFLSYFQTGFQSRLILITALAAWLYASMTHHVWKSVQRTFVSNAWLIVLLAGIVINAIRCVTALDPATVGSHHLSPMTQHKIYLTGLALLTVLNPTGFFLLATYRLNHVLEVQANFDPLTGLLNRRALLHRVQSAMPHRASHRKHTLLLIDIDHFKAINDTYGHDTGDRVLRHFADSVRVGLGHQDYFARFGGDEFVLLLLNTGKEPADSRTRCIFHALKSAKDSDLPPYTCSIGLATQNSPGEDFSSLLKRADIALYHAKQNGRDGIVCAK